MNETLDDFCGEAGPDVLANRIQGLSELVAQRDARQLPPVEAWDPPYSGNIGLAIEVDGRWTYRGSPIERDGLVRLFASVLKREEDGRYFLVTPVEKYDVDVQDAPFLAVEMEVTGHGREQRLTFRTNLDDIIVCGPSHPLRFSIEAANGGFKPYVGVRGLLEARLTRALSYDLAELALNDRLSSPEHPADQPGVWSDGQFFALTVT